MFGILAAVHSDSVRHTAGRPGKDIDAVWAEANSFFGHGPKKAAKAAEGNKGTQALSIHSAAYEMAEAPSDASARAYDPMHP